MRGLGERIEDVNVCIGHLCETVGTAMPLEGSFDVRDIRPNLLGDVPRCCALEFALAAPPLVNHLAVGVVQMDWDPNDVCLVGDPASNRLPDPPRCVCRELVTLGDVE